MDGIRTSVMVAFEIGRICYLGKVGFFKGKSGPVKKTGDFGCLLRYGMRFGMCGPKKVRRVMDVEKLADQWIEAVVGMCICHSKDEYDAHDAKADDLLGPIMTAPVKQVREFYHLLLEKMKADKRVPMLIWMGFEAWGEVKVKDAPDEGVKRLKNKLAKEIADLVEEPIRDQIPGAIARALRWRDEETLKDVKEAVKRGVKPKLRGKQSCLFLEGGRGSKKFSVML